MTRRTLTTADQIPEHFQDSDFILHRVSPEHGEYACETERCPHLATVSFCALDEDGGGGPSLCDGHAVAYYHWLTGKGPKPGESWEEWEGEDADE